ncbi:MAG: phage integrase SAM-like domain-containing protein [Flavimaricola sp.]|nr:phage integrase SAM-like domain-containing protein [Flavimaricola sp.]
MSDYPATTLSMNKGKWYVYLTIPHELREHFGGRKQLKKSTGTSDFRDARRRQHSLTTELYAQLDACKPDARHVISRLLGDIGDVDEVERLHNEGHLEGMINYLLFKRYEPDPHDDWVNERYHERGKKARDAYHQWEAGKNPKTAPSASNVLYSVAVEEYLATQPYGPAKTMRDCELSLQQFMDHIGDLPLEKVTAVMIHQYAENLGATMGRKTIAKKVSYVKRMFDHAVRKGWIPSNVFAGLVMDKKVGRPKESYRPFTPSELQALFKQTMPDHSHKLLSILITTGMRLDEAALLDWEDIKADQDGIVYYDLTDKLVKNKGSQRRVPVHSSLTWITEGHTKGRTGQVFPQFTRDKDGKAQASASKALMPLIRRVTDDKAKVVHSLRGNFKDMLRDAGVSKEVNDFITGHASGDVAGNYGSGPSLRVRKDAVERLNAVTG